MEFSLEHEYVFRFTDQKLLGLQLPERQLLLLLDCELSGPHQQHYGVVGLNSFVFTKMDAVNFENPQIISHQRRLLLDEVLPTILYY